MTPQVRNLFNGPGGREEEIRQLHLGNAFRLEHIVSHGQSSPVDFWYNQPQDEWVALIRGTATLEFKSGGVLPLTSGDYLLIPAHCEHRVAASSADAHWLALHFDQVLTPND